jgi:hypothetical protein
MNHIKFSIHENWVRDYLQPRYPELVAPYREAAQITLDAARNGVLSDADLSILLTHAADRRTVLSINVASMLGKLAGLFPPVEQAIERMAQSSKQITRQNAVLALLDIPPCALHKRIYTAALQDKSKKIRIFAARDIQCYGIASLIPALEQAVENEQDAEVQKNLDFHLSLLRDGWLIDPQENGYIWVSCCSKGGGSHSQPFDPEQFKTEGKVWIEEETAKWKKSWIYI